jgi:hypothetical protein
VRVWRGLRVRRRVWGRLSRGNPWLSSKGATHSGRPRSRCPGTTVASAQRAIAKRFLVSRFAQVSQGFPRSARSCRSAVELVGRPSCELRSSKIRNDNRGSKRSGNWERLRCGQSGELAVGSGWEWQWEAPRSDDWYSRVVLWVYVHRTGNRHFWEEAPEPQRSVPQLGL